MYRKQANDNSELQKMSTIETSTKSSTGIKTIDKISEIPVVNTAITNVCDYYGQIKEKNTILRTSCTLAELSLKTMKFASTPITSLCKNQVNTVDDYLSYKVDQIEKICPSIQTPTKEITTAAYDLYDRTNYSISHPKETLYNFKDLTVSTAATCGNKVLDTCFENKYAKMLTEPVLGFTERSLDYYIPEPSMYENADKNTVSRIYNINKRVYSHVYDQTFIQLPKLHSHFERTIEKMISLKKLMTDVYKQKQEQLLETIKQSTLAKQCEEYLSKKDLSISKLESIARTYFKTMLQDISDIIDKYMGTMKAFPKYFNGESISSSFHTFKSHLNKENFDIYLSMTIDYLKNLNSTLISYTNQMIEAVSRPKESIKTMSFQGKTTAEQGN